MFSRLRSFAGGMLHRDRLESEMEAEMREHIGRHVEDLVNAGVPREKALRRARLEFGSIETAKEDCRRSVGLRRWDEFRRDLRYGARVLRKSPAFTLTAITTLALCIGANTAIYSVVDAVLLRPLPYPQPDRLAQVSTFLRGPGFEGYNHSQDGRTWFLIRDHATSLDVAVVSDWPIGVNFAAGSRAENVRQQRIGAGFFRVLRIPLLAGREFTDAEDKPNGPPVAILSYELWKRAFDGDPSAVGRAALLRGEPYTIVGIAPRGFSSGTPADIWTPLQPSTKGEGGGDNYRIAARLRDGVGWPQARAQVEAIGAEVVKGFRLERGQSARLELVPAQRGLTEDLRRPLFVLWGAVVVLLLIGCSNVGGLLLARAAARKREIGTRMALGGGRGAVIRQLLTESLLLAIAGAVAGVGIGYAGARLLGRVAADTMKVWQDVRLDFRVLAVTAGVALLTTLLFGLLPAFETVRVDIRSALGEGGARGIAGGVRRWPRRAFVAGEVALGVVLLVSAGLLIRTFWLLSARNPGCDTANVVAGKISLLDVRYKGGDAANRFFTESLARMRQIPGVEAAAVALTAPYERWLNVGIRRRDGPDTTEYHFANLNYVTPEYFRVLRVPVLRGRAFMDADTASSAPVAVVTQEFVRKYFGGADAVGHQIDTGEPREIVGVAGDTQQAPGFGDYGPIGATPAVYIPAAQLGNGGLLTLHAWFSPTWLVRAAGPQQGITAGMQRAVEAVDPLLPFAGFRSMDDVRYRAIARQRLQATLLAALAGLALLLAAIGLYGLIANSVAERTRELGIRLALGATSWRAIIAVALPGIALAAGGVALGCVLARVAVTVIKDLLWGVPATDPLTFAVVAGLLLAVALASSLLPALRIVRLNPADTLRAE